MLPRWFAAERGGAGEVGPRHCLPRGGNHLLRIAEESSFLHCFACLVGMGELENVFFSFFLKTILFNLSHSWKNHNPPSSLPGLQFWKTCIYPATPCFRGSVWSSNWFYVNEFEAETFMNVLGLQTPVVWHHLNTQIVNFKRFPQFLPLSQISYETHFPRNWPRNPNLLPQLL